MYKEEFFDKHTETNSDTHTRRETSGFDDIDVILSNQHKGISSINADERHQGNIEQLP